MSIDEEELLDELTRCAMFIRRARTDEHGNHHGHGGEQDYGHSGPHGRGQGERCHGGPHGRGQEECGHGGQHGHHGEGGPHECHHSQHRILALLSVKEGLSQKDLAYVLGIRPQTMSEALRKMESHGLIERRKDADDGRVVKVYLTEKGKERAAESAQYRAQFASDVFATLTEEEKEQLATILEKITAQLENKHYENCEKRKRGDCCKNPEREKFAAENA